jgi:hypothetical protein
MGKKKKKRKLKQKKKHLKEAVLWWLTVISLLVGTISSTVTIIEHFK